MTVEDQHTGRDAICVNCHQTITIPSKPYDPSQIPVAPASAQMGSIPSSVFPPSPGYDPSQIGGQSGLWFKPHRGGLILALGISCLVCVCCCGCVSWLFGLLALIMGSSDLADMRSGKMDPSGKGVTQVGIVLAAAAMAMSALFLLIGFGLNGGPGIPHGFPTPRYD